MHPRRGGHSPPPAPPQPALATEEGGGSKLEPGAPRDRTCAGAASRTGARRLRIPCRLGGGACAAGAGARPGPAWGWGGGGRLRPPPERVRAGREGHEDRERTCKGATLHWGGGGCGSGAAAEEGGRRGASQPAAVRGRVCRGPSAGRSRLAPGVGGSAVAAGAAGGGAARPKRRLQPRSVDAGRGRGEWGKEGTRRGLGELGDHSPLIQGPSVRISPPGRWGHCSRSSSAAAAATVSQSRHRHPS